VTKKDKNEDKPKDDLKLVCAAIEKKFGKGSICTLTETSIISKDAISTGSIGLNTALGIGGYPRGRIIEVYGPNMAGKSTLCLHAVTEAQKAGIKAAYIDAEHGLDPGYAQALGIDLGELLVSQPDCGEEALEIVSMLVESGKVGLIIVDSVAALVPRAELKGEIGDSQPGAQARLMSQALRMTTPKIHQALCTVIFINQIRYKIGVIFGSPETVSGGNALQHYASIRLDVRRIGDVKIKERIVGNKTKVKVVKNKVAAPKREAYFDIRFGVGIDKNIELLELAIQDGIVIKNGSWYSFDETKIAQGLENCSRWMDKNPEKRERIATAVMELRGLV
jgi:recombination protein RecA